MASIIYVRMGAHTTNHTLGCYSIIRKLETLI